MKNQVPVVGAGRWVLGFNVVYSLFSDDSFKDKRTKFYISYAPINLLTLIIVKTYKELGFDEIADDMSGFLQAYIYVCNFRLPQI